MSIDLATRVGRSLRGRRWLIAVALLAAVARLHADVIISEIMYHPISEDVRDEYIEIYNRGATTVNLVGWRFTSGVRFTFPAVNLNPGAYLVVAADLGRFSTRYPGVQNVVGPWEGTLSNSDEDVDLDDAAGADQDSVHYANEGDWAVRVRGPLDNNHRGWTWLAPHDGGGKSLELIQLNLSNNDGQNWAASLPDGGTPGRANSVASLNVAPLILEATHFPVIPTSSQTVTVTVEIRDEQTNGLIVRIHHRRDGVATFTESTMFDDGAHGDGLAGDRFYGAILPAQPNRAIVEFYLEARDAQGNRRTFPAAAPGETVPVANLLYQVHNTPYTGPLPSYLLIMKETERDELDYIGDTLPDANSDAEMNATFISIDDTGLRHRYNVGLRNRGHGSRTHRPNNYHVAFANDRRWRGVRAINLNTQFPHMQLLGNLIMKQAGVPVADAQRVQVSVNSTNLARAGVSQYGSYVAVESFNGDYTENHFKGDPEGNLYRGVANSTAATEADFYHRGTDPAAYRDNYRKETNASEDDYSDLIELTRVFSDTPANLYAAELNRVLDVHEWLRYFAVNAMFDNNESGLYMGYGDDFALYFGRNDPHALMVAHDHDTILGLGDSPGTATASIFRATALSNFERFLKGPEFGPLYYAHLRGLIRTIFSDDQFHPLIEEHFTGWIPNTVINQVKNFVTARNNYVLGQLPDLVPIGASWKYHQGGTDLGTAWREAAYNDSAWSTGPALLYNESAALPATKRTQLNLNGQTTYYFRHRFNLHPGIGENLDALALELMTILDDGAVVYLNGREIFRLGLPEGTINYGTLATRAIGDAIWEGPFVVPGEFLVAGENVLAVELHQADPTSSDVVFGMTANLLASPSSVPPSRVVFNEVFVRPGSGTPWIELYNRSSSDIDLSGMSLSDNDNLPQKWIIPSGTLIPAHGFYSVNIDGLSAASGVNTGFGLKPNGDDLFLYDVPARGGALLDTIEFGLQAVNFSIGRIPNGTGTDWALNVPTRQAANAVATLSPATNLKINEWLASASVGDDWFELFNPNVNPVQLTGLYLSDDVNNRTDYRIPALSFLGVGPGAFQKMIADSQTSKGAQHADFKLSASGDSIALFTAGGSLMDSVTFGPQQLDVSQGRFPDGSTTIVSFPGSATPGQSNSRTTALTIFPSNGQVWIRFTATAGQGYTLQVSDSTVNNGTWATLRQISPQGSTGPVDSSDWIFPGNRTRIYRLLQN